MRSTTNGPNAPPWRHRSPGLFGLLSTLHARLVLQSLWLPPSSGVAPTRRYARSPNLKDHVAVFGQRPTRAFRRHRGSTMAWSCVAGSAVFRQAFSSGSKPRIRHYSFLVVVAWIIQSGMPGARRSLVRVSHGLPQRRRPNLFVLPLSRGALKTRQSSSAQALASGLAGALLLRGPVDGALLDSNYSGPGDCFLSAPGMSILDRNTRRRRVIRTRGMRAEQARAPVRPPGQAETDARSAVPSLRLLVAKAKLHTSKPGSGPLLWQKTIIFGSFEYRTSRNYKAAACGGDLAGTPYGVGRHGTPLIGCLKAFPARLVLPGSNQMYPCCGVRDRAYRLAAVT